jgi:diguanylate cyclase
MGDEVQVRRDDARPLAVIRPQTVVPAVAAVCAPLAAWALSTSVALGAAWLLASVALCWGAALLSAQVRDQAAELDKLRSVDPLTGLPNRRVWDDALPRELARADRAGTPLAVGVIAVDGFEGYVDERGRQSGDMLLKELASLWPSELRDSDLLARYGEHEFALLLPDCGISDVQRVVDKVRTATPSGVTCSVGIATWDGLEEPSALVRRADAALVAAKREPGGATVVAAGGPRPEPAGA